MKKKLIKFISIILIFSILVSCFCVSSSAVSITATTFGVAAVVAAAAALGYTVITSNGDFSAGCTAFANAFIDYCGDSWNNVKIKYTALGGCYALFNSIVWSKLSNFLNLNINKKWEFSQVSISSSTLTLDKSNSVLFDFSNFSSYSLWRGYFFKDGYDLAYQLGNAVCILYLTSSFNGFALSSNQSTIYKSPSYPSTFVGGFNFAYLMDGQSIGTINNYTRFSNVFVDFTLCSYLINGINCSFYSDNSGNIFCNNKFIGNFVDLQTYFISSFRAGYLLGDFSNVFDDYINPSLDTPEVGIDYNPNEKTGVIPGEVEVGQSVAVPVGVTWSDTAGDITCDTDIGGGDITYPAGRDVFNPTLDIPEPKLKDYRSKSVPDSDTDTTDTDITGEVTKGTTITNDDTTIDGKKVIDGTQSPTVTVDDTNTDTGTIDTADEDISNDTDTNTNKLKLSSKIIKKFPFSLPFDFYNGIKSLSASEVDPIFKIPIKIDKFGLDYTLTINLDIMPKLTKFIRYIIAVSFVISLILITKKLIWS